MFGLGHWELLLIGLIVFLIFGAKRIPEIGKGLGGAVREFRSVKKELNAQPQSKDVEGGKTGTEEKDPAGKSLEMQAAGKVLSQVPGVRRAMDLKDKVDKVKKIIN